MNKELREIVDKCNEFVTYLNNVDVKALEKFSREELMEFEKELRSATKYRYLTGDVNAIILEKKKQEFPELLGVHHFPCIKKIDFLSEEDKIKLDKYLSQFRCGAYIHMESIGWTDLSKRWGKETSRKVLEFLHAEGVTKRYRQLYLCCNNSILQEEVLEKLLRFYDLRHRNKSLNESEYAEYCELEEFYEENSHKMCEDCDEEVELTEKRINEILSSDNNHLYKIIIPRDTKLDNV